MNIVVLGGGQIGVSLTQMLLSEHHRVHLIDRDPDRSVRLANLLDIEVTCGDGTEPRTLEAVDLRHADCFIALSNNDADNIVAAQLAIKHFGVKKVVARVNDPRNMDTYHILGVEYAVSGTEIVAKIIQQEANLMEFRLVASLNRGHGQICSVVLGENSALHGKEVRNLVFPKDCLLISLVRKNKLIIPAGTTVLMSGDEIIAVCVDREKKALIRMLNSTVSGE